MCKRRTTARRPEVERKSQSAASRSRRGRTIRNYSAARAAAAPSAPRTEVARAPGGGGHSRCARAQEESRRCACISHAPLSARSRSPVPPPSVSCFTRHTGARPRAPLGPHARYPVSPSARPASVCIAWSLRTQCWSREDGVLRTIKDIPSQPIAAGCRPACRAARAATHAGTKHTRAYMGAIARSHLELGWW